MLTGVSDLSDMVWKEDARHSPSRCLAEIQWDPRTTDFCEPDPQGDRGAGCLRGLNFPSVVHRELLSEVGTVSGVDVYWWVKDQAYYFGFSDMKNYKSEMSKVIATGFSYTYCSEMTAMEDLKHNFMRFGAEKNPHHLVNFIIPQK